MKLTCKLTALLLTVLSVSVSQRSLQAEQLTGGFLQEAFFEAIESEDPEKLLALCRDDMRGVIDVPVLAAWMKAFHAATGDFERVSFKDFEVKLSLNDGVLEEKNKATVECTNGNATCRLVAVDGKLVSFDAESELLPDEWFQGPTSTDLYQERGAQFILLCFAGSSNVAYDRMHPALQEMITREELAEMIQAELESGGHLKSIDFKEAELDFSDGQRLLVYYDLQLADKTLLAKVEFQFVGLQGHLIGFRFWNQ